MNETFTNEDEAREIFGRLSAGTTLKLGLREFLIRGNIESEDTFAAEVLRGDPAGLAAGQTVYIALESILATLNAGLEVKIVEAADNFESPPAESEAD